MTASPALERTRKTNATDLLWQHLPRLRHFSFRASPGQRSATQWLGAGHGQISARADGDDWLLAERGHFRPDGALRELPFRNIYRWQRLDDRLRLSHERFGAGNAVFLFELVATDPTHLVCALPHLCGSDNYRGSIDITVDGFDFNWSITGPRKHEHLYYSYRTG